MPSVTQIGDINTILLILIFCVTSFFDKCYVFNGLCVATSMSLCMLVMYGIVKLLCDCLMEIKQIDTIINIALIIGIIISVNKNIFEYIFYPDICDYVSPKYFTFI